MTDLLYMSDSYLREFDAVVEAVDESGQVILRSDRVLRWRRRPTVRYRLSERG